MILSSFTTGCSRDSAGSSTQLIVSGSTTVLPIAEIAGEGFEEKNEGVSVLVSGLGSSAGIESVAAGTSDIGTASRDLKDSEQDLGLIDTPIASDGIAVIVNPANPVQNLTIEQLQAIYSGEILNWSEVGGEDREIDLVNRDEASGTREAFKKLVMGETPFDRRAAVLPGTGQVRDVIARSEGSIGYISVGFVKSRFTRTTVKVVSVDGVLATADTVASGEYPISRKLHMFTKGEPAGLAREYLDYILSPDIQNGAVVDAGFVPIAAGGGR